MKLILVQVIALCHQATSHYLSQSWPRFVSPYGLTGPQCVKQAKPHWNDKFQTSQTHYIMMFIGWTGWAHFGRFQMVPQWWTMPMWLWPCPDWLQQTNAMSFLQEQQHWHLTIQSQHSQPLFVLLRVGKSDNRGHVLPRCHLLRLQNWYPHIWGNHCNPFKIR